VEDNQNQEFLEAVKAGDRTKVHSLLNHQPELIHARTEVGVSAVMLAIYYGHVELASELANGQELDFFEAAALGDNHRVAHLIKQDSSSINAYSPDGFTALGYAAFFGHPETLELLLNAGAQVDQPARNQMRVCPLHAAVAHRHPEVALAVVKMLLERGAEANIRQQGEWTPLHEAAARGHQEMVQLLLSHGADVNAKNEEGKTPFEMAIEKGHPEVAEMVRPSAQPS